MGLIEWLGFNGPSNPRDAPDIQNNVRDSGTIFYFGKANSGERVDERTAMQISTVYACVRLLAESIAQLPLHLYRVGDGNRNEKAKGHPLYKILYREPNPEMTSFSFWEAMATHLLLWGNAYAQIVRDGRNNVLGLYPLLPENVTVDRNAEGRLCYIYSMYQDDTPTVKTGETVFQRHEILHIPGLSFNGLVGFSPIAMMKNALGATMAVEKYGSSFFKNGAQPSGVLEHPGILKNPEKIRENWSDVYGGAGNAHKVAVLEEGMHYNPISLPPEDSQFLSTREFSVEEICRIFRVPPHMVQDLKRATFSNIEHQSIDFVVHTLDPWLVRIEKAIVKDVLIESEKDDYYPKFNVEGLLRGDYKSRMEGYQIGIDKGMISINEARVKENLPLLGQEQGGDFHIVNGTYIKLEDVGKQYGVMESEATGDTGGNEGTASEGDDTPEGTGPSPTEGEGQDKRQAERRQKRRGKAR